MTSRPSRPSRPSPTLEILHHGPSKHFAIATRPPTVAESKRWRERRAPTLGATGDRLVTADILGRVPAESLNPLLQFLGASAARYEAGVSCLDGTLAAAPTVVLFSYCTADTNVAAANGNSANANAASANANATNAANAAAANANAGMTTHSMPRKLRLDSATTKLVIKVRYDPNLAAPDYFAAGPSGITGAGLREVVVLLSATRAFERYAGPSPVIMDLASKLTFAAWKLLRLGTRVVIVLEGEEAYMDLVLEDTLRDPGLRLAVIAHMSDVVPCQGYHPAIANISITDVGSYRARVGDELFAQETVE